MIEVGLPSEFDAPSLLSPANTEAWRDWQANAARGARVTVVLPTFNNERSAPVTLATLAARSPDWVEALTQAVSGEVDNGSGKVTGTRDPVEEKLTRVSTAAEGTFEPDGTTFT